ncbi:glycosyltransferase family 32 protein [Mangrovicoccus algicola]|uniref:Uncharacterized protein n=1 Tax=Mangrovicoccus algicola TaxID=2771008 RepID=A0A8J6YWY2_9RHOB|nr:glycosyltransferase [Mangrovicoccus algicola]MBE3637568.1 hypothetical protein [Mangrovicoccus algicola]
MDSGLMTISDPAAATAAPSRAGRRFRGAENPLLLLKYCDLCLQMGRLAEARHALDSLGGAPPAGWPPQFLVGLMRTAEKAGMFRLAAAVLRAALAQDRVPPLLASHALGIAQSSGQSALAERLVPALAPRLPDHVRSVFRDQGNLLLAGPFAALERLRAAPMAGRTPAQAAVVAQVLIEAGERRLALRYLRACRHRWPAAFAILRMEVVALIRFGRAGEALSRLEGLPAGRLSEAMRFSILLALARHEQAQALLKRAAAGQLAAPSVHEEMRLAVARGDLERAEELAPLVAARTGRGATAMNKFRVSHAGAWMNEMQLLRQVAGGLPLVPGEGPTPYGDLHHVFYLPARLMTERWQAAGRGMPAGAAAAQAIPRRVVQYWDSDRPPAMLQQVMQSWQRPGYDYRLFSRRSAREWLRSEMGEDHLRAFGLAGSPTEEADFLRLCLLLKDGGIYADADDLLVAAPETLRRLGGGAILFREADGAVANNLIIARPGHPLLRHAVTMACEAMLRRDNDSPWSKTGPGLLTRAAAVYLGETPEAEARADLVILPDQALMRRVQTHMRLPYKSTPEYWNAADGRAPQELMSVLRELADRGA